MCVWGGGGGGGGGYELFILWSGVLKTIFLGLSLDTIPLQKRRLPCFYSIAVW